MLKSDVHLMDCVEFMRALEDGCFDLAIVDPPYGLPDRSGKGAGKLQNRIIQKMHQKGWDIAPTAEYFEQLFRISKNQIIWGGNYFHLPPTRGVGAWDKMQPWENFSQIEIAWTSFDVPAWLFKFDNRTGNKQHPTQKPIELYRWLLHRFAKPNDTIFDSHMGSQSSRIACHMEGFDFTGCELDPEYFEQGNARYESFLKTYGTADPTQAIKGQQINLF